MEGWDGLIAPSNLEELQYTISEEFLQNEQIITTEIVNPDPWSH